MTSARMNPSKDFYNFITLFGVGQFLEKNSGVKGLMQ
jgi:hypothetical protein